MAGSYLGSAENTKRCAKKLVCLLDDRAPTIPMEDGKAVAAKQEKGIIVLA